MFDAKRLLIIDDDRQLVLCMSIRLRAAGYDVSTAFDGSGGLALVKDHSPDVIILDLRMRAMSGLEVLAELRKSPRTSTIPVIVVSANVNEQTREKALGLGALCCIVKPFHASDLVAAIELATGSCVS